MYKTRLQEICQQRGWPLPAYTVSRDGPDHFPRFGATVTVNGVSFDAPDPSKSSKEAQGKAALAAINHFATSASASASASASVSALSLQCSSLALGNYGMYKSQLEELCRQRMYPSAEYNVIRDGPDHSPRFRATVTVNGTDFAAPDVSRSLKEAQGKAAKVALDHFAIVPSLEQSPVATPAPSSSALSFQSSTTPQVTYPMYKNQLEGICRQRLWPLPKYSTSREGLEHNPQFCATVTVNGANFDAPDLSRSLKEAEGKAAQVAFNNFALLPPTEQAPTTTPSSPITTPSSPSENQVLYKSLLQIYLQKKNIIYPPKYDVIRDGSASRPRFKATVSVDGQTFHSPHFFNTLREAEHDAAKVALAYLSLEENENPQEETVFYKNLLQEILQKEGVSLPKYNIIRDGALNMPVFSSVVEIEGESFVGDVASSKKQAEMNAAKVAWCQLKERFNARSGRLGLASSRSQSSAVGNMEQLKPLSVPATYFKINEDSEDKVLEDGITRENDSSSVLAPIPRDDQVTHASREIMVNGKIHTGNVSSSLHNLDIEASSMERDGEKYTLSRDGSLSPYAASDCYDYPNTDATSEFSMAETLCSLQHNRVQVYPRKPNMVLPEGGSILPFSDDKWVAVSLDLSNREGK